MRKTFDAKFSDREIVDRIIELIEYNSQCGSGSAYKKTVNRIKDILKRRK